MAVFIYNRGHANGIRVIIDNLINALSRQGIRATEIDSLEKCPKSSVVIPYGVLESWQLVNNGYKTYVALLVDAISLGYKNKVLFYLKNHYFLHYDFLYSIYGFLRYSRMERQVLNAYKNVMLVSQKDIDYLKRNRLSYNVKYFCVPNGANMVNHISEKTPSRKLRLGVLASFGSRQSFEENNWFFKRIFKKYSNTHPNVELIVAGRGDYIYRIKAYKNVRILGEVDDLDSFFKDVDVFLSLNPKGCGILNRVLDAVAFKTAIVGISSSFSGFKDYDNCFKVFSDYDSFCKAIDNVRDISYRNKLITNASDNIQTNHNWSSNYDLFAESLKSLICES